MQKAAGLQTICLSIRKVDSSHTVCVRKCSAANYNLSEEFGSRSAQVASDPGNSSYSDQSNSSASMSAGCGPRLSLPWLKINIYQTADNLDPRKGLDFYVLQSKFHSPAWAQDYDHMSVQHQRHEIEL